MGFVPSTFADKSIAVGARGGRGGHLPTQGGSVPLTVPHLAVSGCLLADTTCLLIVCMEQQTNMSTVVP